MGCCCRTAGNGIFFCHPHHSTQLSRFRACRGFWRSKTLGTRTHTTQLSCVRECRGLCRKMGHSARTGKLVYSRCPPTRGWIQCPPSRGLDPPIPRRPTSWRVGAARPGKQCEARSSASSPASEARRSNYQQSSVRVLFGACSARSRLPAGLAQSSKLHVPFSDIFWQSCVGFPWC